ncbi:MAG: hypothetical protein ACLGSD_19865 [Acidobacteriota bacterium]
MRADRLLIVTGVFLGVGLWCLLAFCKGNVGVGFALPVAGTRFNMDVTTMGVPALIGMPVTIIGLVLLVVSFIAAIIGQFRPYPPRRKESVADQEPSPRP